MHKTDLLLPSYLVYESVREDTRLDKINKFKDFPFIHH